MIEDWFSWNLAAIRLLGSWRSRRWCTQEHYDDVIMTSMASEVTSLTIVYSTVYSDADQRKHQSSASLAFVRGIHRSPVNSPHKWPVTRKMFPFDDVIMNCMKRLLTGILLHRKIITCGIIIITYKSALVTILLTWRRIIENHLFLTITTLCFSDENWTDYHIIWSR